MHKEICLSLQSHSLTLSVILRSYLFKEKNFFGMVTSLILSIQFVNSIFLSSHCRPTVLYILCARKILKKKIEKVNFTCSKKEIKQTKETRNNNQEKLRKMQSPRTNNLNGAISSLPSTLAQLALRDKQQPPPPIPHTLPPSGGGNPSSVLSKAVSLLQQAATANGSGNNVATNNLGHNDSNKLTTELLEKEQQNQMQQQKQKPPLPARQKAMEIAGYVGFANLPNQVYRKAVKRGFEFTLMVVGCSGLGKSTLINSMFLSDIYNNEENPGPSLRKKKTVAVEATEVLLQENGVNLKLTVVDTPGFGDSVDNTNCWVPILEYVDSKYEEYLTAESQVFRKQIPDNRVHCCLYFIGPTGHGLRSLDIACMQSLSDKVNLVPVIGKADTLTPDEVHLFKKQILNEIAQHKIKIYDFPSTIEDAADETETNQSLRNLVPFAVVGANTIIETPDGKKVRGRRYPWGLVEVENLTHCDFIALRNMVIRTHLQDLKDVTDSVHYENYRCRKLSELGLVDSKARLSNKNPLTQMEEEKREHELKMKKMEAEMEQVFDMKVKEKMQKLKDSELELARRHEERKKALELQIRELDEKRREFERERKEWEEINHITLEELKRRSLGANSSSDNVDGKKEKKKKGLF